MDGIRDWLADRVGKILIGFWCCRMIEKVTARCWMVGNIRSSRISKVWMEVGRSDSRYLSILNWKKVIFHDWPGEWGEWREGERARVYTIFQPSSEKENKTRTTPKLPCCPNPYKTQTTESIFSSQISFAQDVLKEKSDCVYIVLYPTPSKSI